MIHRRPLLAGAAATLALATARPARAAEEMTVILDWLMNPNHAALFAADQSGAFSRAGLSVKLISPSDPDSPVRLVAAGQADLAVSYGTQINMIDSAGLPLLRVASLINAPLNTVTALGGGNIRTLADLKGKKIGVSVGGVEDAVLYVMLESVGISPGDVTPVKVNYGMVPALLSGGLDAAIGAYRNAEVLQIRQMGRTPLVFLPEEHGVPLYDELILVTRRDRRDDPRIKRFVGALHEGTTALLRAPMRCGSFCPNPSGACNATQSGKLDRDDAGGRHGSGKAGRQTLSGFPDLRSGASTGKNCDADRRFRSGHVIPAAFGDDSC